MLNKVISGCQTGADLGGLEAALEYGILTGGTVTKGCKTEDGNHPEFVAKFNLVEHYSDNYSVRTRANVFHSDGTILFLNDDTSPGTRCTKNAIREFEKTSYVIKIKTGEEISEELIDGVVDWIAENNIKTLNVAGNRESKSPGIQKAVKNFLKKVFDEYKYIIEGDV